jgi:hypothetical protein
MNPQTAWRIIGTEYAQNLPFLIGLMSAQHLTDWPLIGLALALGAVGVALMIALTERIKLQKSTAEPAADLAINTATFFVGGLLYAGYFHLARRSVAEPLLLDIAVGALLGTLIGLAQGVGLGERRFSRAELRHLIGLALAGMALLALLGTVSAWPPLLAAVVLCVPMTLIIVRLDYWPLLMK